DLLPDGRNDARMRVTKRRAPQPGQAIEEPPAIRHREPGALAGGDQARRCLEITVVREGHPPGAELGLAVVGMEGGGDVHGGDLDRKDYHSEVVKPGGAGTPVRGTRAGAVP